VKQRAAQRRPRPRRAALSVATLLCALSVAAFAAGCAGAVTGGPSPSSPSPSPTPSAAILIKPGLGAVGVAPGRSITVRVHNGHIVRVVATTGGAPVGGTLNAAGTIWRSRTTLHVAARCAVWVKAVDAAGRTVTKHVWFHTLVPTQTFSAEVFESAGGTYGVGMPIILYFDRPITDRQAVEHALSLRTSRRVVGAWYWDGDSTLSFRPRDYWPAGTVVHLVARLNGVAAAPGVYGAHDLTQSFRIGEALIVVADTATHRCRVYRGHRLFADWPMSSGRPGDDTPNGTYLTIDKGNPVEMKGPGYDLLVPWSVRFTWSGDYLHDAYWSVGEQGFSNVSHGCINLSPQAAQTYYELEVPGDPVTVKGSPRGGVWDNGWTVWFLSFKQLLAGSALHRAVVAGRHGSSFVRPGSLKASHARAPLHRPWAGNATAS